jgi:hypothetical protein
MYLAVIGGGILLVLRRHHYSGLLPVILRNIRLDMLVACPNTESLAQGPSPEWMPLTLRIAPRLSHNAHARYLKLALQTLHQNTRALLV